jgi:glutathione S-transferase
MPPNPEKFTLRSTLTSPFGRKVRMAAEVLGLMERITLQPADPLDEADTLRAQNPLGKMPCLLTAGGAIYDSGVIIEYLAEVAGSDRLIPARGPQRYQALTRARLADGITEAALLVVYEGRYRDDPASHSERWLKHQRGKIMRALAAFEATPPDPRKSDIVAIGLACALGYLDWRKPVDWRPSCPGLARWLAAFSNNEPAFERTRAPDA